MQHPKRIFVKDSTAANGFLFLTIAEVNHLSIGYVSV
jgi:hypothetical protein